MSGKWWIAVGALLMSVAVTAGAVGTHLLRDKWELPARELAAFETAVQFNLFHALALILVGLLANQVKSRWLPAVGFGLLAGIILFTGGIYAWVFSGNEAFVRIVPTGGVIWIITWLVFAVGAASYRAPNSN